MKKKKIAIICGGPSAERGISLNSARSLYDNLNKDDYEISLFYFNPRLNAFKITSNEIYSNTPLDFDYKLSLSKRGLTIEEFKKEISNVDFVFPAIHGLFGEDGQLQKILEDAGVKYVGSNPAACKNTSDKYLCQQILKENGYFTVNNYTVKRGEELPKLPKGKYVVKPLHGGSSIGVHFFETQKELEEKIEHVWQCEDDAIIEPFVEGTEFTIIVLQNSEGKPVALLPTEIEFRLKDNKFFNYRKKYLATSEIHYHTPTRFSETHIKEIRNQAEKLFSLYGMKDFARMDGWLLKEGNIWFSDINAISGMEQNSFLFQQPAVLGLSHNQLLSYIINKNISVKSDSELLREEIPVLFGGNTAERQISVMSGTNVWMKLKSSNKYKPIPLFLSSDNNIFHIPQFLCLLHTVEEIEEKIIELTNNGALKRLKKYQSMILDDLGISIETIDEMIFVPTKITFKEISEKYNFLFIGLHGGNGENGVLQTKLNDVGVAYNGPGAKSSKLCMDKYLTGKQISEANIEGIYSINKTIVKIDDNIEENWNKILGKDFSLPIILKPRDEGCSAGVIQISNFDQFKKAIKYFNSEHRSIPGNAIHESHGQIDLPHEKLDEILVEEFIVTDNVTLKDMEINWKEDSDTIEVTVGVFGTKDKLHSFFPSQTIANRDVLSIEEKFMGGTGVNLTPPPIKYVNHSVVERVKSLILQTAKILGISGYARIDTFMNIKTGDIKIIEANTLPALTPSTVIFHQALSEPEPMTPLQLIEKIIEIGKENFIQKKIKTDRKPGFLFKTPKIESFENKASTSP